MATYTLSANKFIGALVNLVTYTMVNDTLNTSPLKEFNEWFKGEDIPFGTVGAITSVDIPESQDMSETSSLTKVNKPTTTEEFVEITKYKMIPITVNKYLMRGAFFSESSLYEFIDYVLRTLPARKEIENYNECLSALESWTPTQATQTITLSLVTPSTTATESEKMSTYKNNARTILLALRKVCNKFKADTKEFNDLGYNQLVSPSSLGLFINSDYDDLLDVDTYASVFGADYIKNGLTWGKHYAIPVSKISTANQSKLIGILCGRRKVCYSQGYQVATSFFDGSNLNDNHWLQYSYGVSVIKGIPAVKFVTK